MKRQEKTSKDKTKTNTRHDKTREGKERQAGKTRPVETKAKARQEDKTR
jgi:hypothetical protein